MPKSVNAQQQTGQVAPETRNPQTNQTELFKQQSGVQTTGPQQVLGQSRNIIIPEGQPASPDADNVGRDSSGLLPVLIVLTFLGAIACGAWFVRTKPVTAVETEKVPDEPPQTIVQPALKRKKPKKSKSRKKRR